LFFQTGGTTDIAVHEITGLDTLKEIHPPCGGHWGGITVNNEFYDSMLLYVWIQSRGIRMVFLPPGLATSSTLNEVFECSNVCHGLTSVKCLNTILYSR
jgi:hypothetical protein